MHELTNTPTEQSPEPTEAAGSGRTPCPLWCGGHTAVSATAVVHTARTGVARHENIRAAIFISRRDENGAIGEPLISVSFKAEPGPLMLPDPIDHITAAEALDLAGRWDLIRAAELAEALREAARKVDVWPGIDAQIREVTEQVRQVVAARHGERRGRLLVELIDALLTGRVEPDHAVELAEAVSRGDLGAVDAVEQVVRRLPA